MGVSTETISIRRDEPFYGIERSVAIREHFLRKLFWYHQLIGIRRNGRNSMTQTQIIQALADKGEVTKKVAKSLLDKLAATAVAEVKKNGVFVLPGIGRLVRVDRKARMGRNPATGETIKIAAKKVVKFRVAKAAKDAIVPPKVKKA
jgi:DNA-binding protein HU-beta